MQLIDDGTQGPTTVPTKQPASGTPGYGYGGPPGSTPSSRWNPDVANTVLAEMAGVATALGDSLDRANNGQMLSAIQRIAAAGRNGYTSNVTLTGAAQNGMINLNAAGGSFTVTLPAANLAGPLRYWLFRTDINTAATVTISASGGAVFWPTGATSLVMNSADVLFLESDSLNWIVLQPPTSGRLLNIRYFTAAGTTTYTPTVGTNSVYVEVQGAGGGAAGNPGTTSGQIAAAGPGGDGAYAAKRLTSGFSGATIVVGAGGNGGAGVAGTNGGASSFGAVTANGGGGAPTPVVGSSSSTISAGAGSPGAAGVTGDLNIGATSSNGTVNVAGAGIFGIAGPTLFGTCGAGGNGAAYGISTGATIGTPGNAGIVRVWEYS